METTAILYIILAVTWWIPAILILYCVTAVKDRIEKRRLRQSSSSQFSQKKAATPQVDSPSQENTELEKCKKDIEKLKDDIEKKNEIIDQLRRKLFDYEHAKKTKERLDSNDMDSLINKNHELSQINDELDAENFSLELKLAEKETIIEKLLKDARESDVLGYNAADITHMLERLHDLENLEARLDHEAISSSRRDTWGDLKGKRYGTLTPEQQSQIHFPILDPACVYFLPSHPTFHSVYWCYSLDNSPRPSKTTLDNAIYQELKPCSKCVDPDLYNDYLIQSSLKNNTAE